MMAVVTEEAGVGERKVWQCGRFEVSLTRPLVMAILNVTPDSFSDGGRFTTFAEAAEAGAMLTRHGADFLDIGGESTRPGADPVSPEEELARTLPVIEALVPRVDVPVSIDTRRASVGERCVAAGASILNDVSGFRDEAMVRLAAGTDVGCIIMHMKGTPDTMQSLAQYDDVVAEVGGFLQERAHALEEAGVARERIAIDPGLGFAKTTEHNLELLRRLPELVALGYPVVVGASRKRFIGEVLGQDTPTERLEGSLGVAAWSYSAGAQVTRVHDVKETARVAKVIGAIWGDS